MSITIKAHFDGKVIVPDEPVDLPVDQSFEAELHVEPAPLRAADIARRRAALRRIASRAVHGVSIPLEALRRENMYEDRL